MTPQFQQHIRQTTFKNVSRIIPALIGVALLAGVFAPAALASSTDCQAVDLSGKGAVEGLTNWKDTSLPLTLTVQRELLPAMFLEAAPLVASPLFNHGLGGRNSCWTPPVRRNSVINHAIVRTFGKGSWKSVTRVMRVPALPYNGSRQVLRPRTILPEVTITSTSRDGISSIIGPVQEAVTSDQSKFAGLGQAVVLQPSTSASSWLRAVRL